ncbi:pyridoxal phosphate-dependent aminotransferase [Leptolyngbya sp. 'hensonii']|uniref:pyridoxal phosphate-dependent aminotransferase n=1 Tax=Leptolyngbya sp. 'hensonii' TaxID=1922337 RepID=UPI000A9A8407|nr:pyridoxal phosphate-dependent aminotransferase [Leptolyngbya sp. 'hensonii']
MNWFTKSPQHLNGKPIDLAIGDPKDRAPEKFRKELCKALKDPKVDRYSPKTGHPDLCHAILEDYARENSVCLEPSHDICITSGAWSSLVACLNVLGKPKGKVGYFDPCFFGIPQIVRAAGMIPCPIPLDAIRGSDADLNHFFQELVVFIHVDPHNPTGYVFTSINHHAIANACHKNNVRVISDRVYKHIYADQKPESFLTYDKTALEVWSFSKSFRMAGWRLGCILGKGHWMQEVREHWSATENGICVATQLAAIPLITGRVGLESFRQEIISRRQCLNTGLTQLGFRADSSPDLATNFVWAGIPRVFQSSTDAAQQLSNFGVLSMPGEKCGEFGQGFLRFALNYPPEILDIAITRIASAIDRYCKEAA